MSEKARRLSFLEDSFTQSGDMSDQASKKSHLGINEKSRRLSFLEDSLTQSGDMSDQASKKNHLTLPGLNEKRQSIWGARKSRRFSNFGSYSSRRSSQMDLSVIQRPKYQNTYKIEPDESKKFYRYKIESRIYSTLENILKRKKYNPNKSIQLTKELTEEVLREARTVFHNSRYKFISHVTVGQMKNQEVMCASRSLWNTNFDDYVSVVYKNEEIFAVATLYAIYYE